VFLLIINLLSIDFIPATADAFADFFQLGTKKRGWILLVILAEGPTLIGFGLYNISLVMLPSSTANLILILEPVITAITAYFLLGERLKPIELVGSGFNLGH
jgi:drug/metabolite transporter (DMT)-like permease